VISLLPARFDNETVKQCVALGKPMIHGNYHTQEAHALDAEARKRGILILGETGLDPGIDHMTAKRVIDHFHALGGEVEDFYSFCGGLPAPEANTNPFGYKFSWAPKQALRVANRPATYIKDGTEVHVDGKDILKKHWVFKINDSLTFEGYANANSLPYVEKYGLHGIKNLLRGTLRYPGWCRLLNTLKDLNLLDESPLMLDRRFSASQMLLRAGRFASRESITTLLLTRNKDAYNALSWLGLLDQKEKVWQSNSAIGVLEELMLQKLAFQPGERDLSIMVHQFGVRFPSGKKYHEALMVDFGEPQGYSSMAKTVGLTMAFAARAILEGKITLKGVQMPVTSDIYQILLPDLEAVNIRMAEREIESLSF
jgi:saccharopine dehydrogenase-like NADP-dependent oxidoreductase